MSDPITTPDGDGGYWFSWEHEHPSIIVEGYIKKSGSYSVTFKADSWSSSSHFGFSFDVEVNGANIISCGVDSVTSSTDITKTGTISGRDFKVVATCGDSSCSNGAQDGKTVIDVTLADLYTPPSWKGLSWKATTRSITVTPSYTPPSEGTYKCYVKIFATDNSGKKIESKSFQREGTSSIVLADLVDGKYYIINAWIGIVGHDNVYYKSSSGSIDIKVATYNLSCNITDKSNVAAQNSIAAEFYAAVSGKYHANLDGYYNSSTGKYDYSMIKFSSLQLLDASKKKIMDLTVPSGDKSKITVENLTSYTSYYLYCEVTDGYNKDYITVPFKTIYPYARIKHGGEWKKAMIYIYSGGEWKLAKGNVYSGGDWKELDGR